MLVSLVLGLCVLACNAQWSPESARGDRGFDRPRSNMNAYGGQNGRPFFNGDRPRSNVNSYGRQNGRPFFDGNSMGRQQFGDRMGMTNMYNGNGMGQRMWQRGDDFMGQGWDDSMSGSWSNEDWSGDWSGEDWSSGNQMGMPRSFGNRMNLRQWDDKDSWFKEDDKDKDWSGDWSGEDWSDGNIWQNGGDRMGPRPGDFMRQSDDFGGKGWDDSMSGSWSNKDRFGEWSDEDSSDSDSSSSESGFNSRLEEYRMLYGSGSSSYDEIIKDLSGSWSGDDSSESDSSSSESESDSSSEEWDLSMLL